MDSDNEFEFGLSETEFEKEEKLLREAYGDTSHSEYEDTGEISESTDSECESINNKRKHSNQKKRNQGAKRKKVPNIGNGNPEGENPQNVNHSESTSIAVNDEPVASPPIRLNKDKIGNYFEFQILNFKF